MFDIDQNYRLKYSISTIAYHLLAVRQFFHYPLRQIQEVCQSSSPRHIGERNYGILLYAGHVDFCKVINLWDTYVKWNLKIIYEYNISRLLIIAFVNCCTIGFNAVWMCLFAKQWQGKWSRWSKPWINKMVGQRGQTLLNGNI